MSRPGLVEFIAARLDDDERIARAAVDDRANGEPEHWRWECAHDDTPLDVDLAIASNDEYLEHECHAGVGLRSVVDYPSSAGMYGHLVIDGEEVRPQDARHIARHDPAQVLAEVAAKRAIAAEHAQGHDSIWCRRCDPAGGDAFTDGDASYPCKTLRLMAAMYAGHPDYDQGWAA